MKMKNREAEGRRIRKMKWVNEIGREIQKVKERSRRKRIGMGEQAAEIPLFYVATEC